MNNDIECPYCGKGLNINHDDGYGYEEGELHQQECGHCEKKFTFLTHISFHYEARKADCLNESEHDYKPTSTWPMECTKMQCSSCGEERSPDVEEWKQIKINRK